MHSTLHETMVEVGARQLQDGLFEHGIVPPSFLRREAEILQACREVQDAWLRGAIASPLYRTVLWEVVRLLRARENDRE